MIHPSEKHQILLTDLRLAPNALIAIMRDHMRDDHAKDSELSGELLWVAHDILHAVDEKQSSMSTATL